jgi:hypothetical protein
MFADDTTLTSFNKDIRALRDQAQPDLDNVATWCRVNLLTINKDKTGYIIFSSPHKSVTNKNNTNNPLKFHMENTEIKLLSDTKFLGVIYQKNVNWSPHVSKIIKKISKYTGIFSKIRHFVSRKTLLTVYNAYIYPQLTYCIEVWGSDVPQGYLNPILKIQKKLARIITYSDWQEPAQKLMVKLGWLNIYDIFKLHIQTIAFDIGTGNLNLNLKLPNLIQLNNHSDLFLKKILMRPDLKHNDFLVSSKLRTKRFGTNSLTARVSKHWNSLTNRERKKTSVFKKNRKLHFLFNPTPYRSFTQTEIDEIIDCIAERRMIKKYYA